jgi:transposase
MVEEPNACRAGRAAQPIVLLSADRDSARAVAVAMGISPATVRLWRQRFSERGPAGLLRDAPGRGRKPALDPESLETLRRRFKAGAVVTTRERGRELGVSASTVSRWRRRKN